MYQMIDGKVAITVKDWLDVGFTMNMFKNDSKRGDLTILRRGIKGNTFIDVRSIKRPDRLSRIEAAIGRLDGFLKGNTPAKERKWLFTFEEDATARTFFASAQKADGTPLEAALVDEYTNRASVFEAIRRALDTYLAARSARNSRPSMTLFWNEAAEWTIHISSFVSLRALGNARSLERTFKLYLSDGYTSIMNKNLGNDSSKKVSDATERLLIALWGTKDKPFVKDVHAMYHEFVNGTRIFFDRQTGEQFNPEDFRHKNRPLELSERTVWNYLKNIENAASVKTIRDGRFNMVNNFSPKHARAQGKFSLSKITMDDVQLTRRMFKTKSNARGIVTKYVYTDVVSGYTFRPAYVAGRPSLETVLEVHRNMVNELLSFGLGKPLEADSEYHLIKDIAWWKSFWGIGTFNESATSKRQEHFNRQQKYGVSKREGHIELRHYGRGAYAGVRHKERGEFLEKEYDFATLVADDLGDIEKWNNSLHPLQKTYPGMTRRDVLLQKSNPKCGKIIPHYHFKMFGKCAKTTIRHNKDMRIANCTFWLGSYDSLERLKPNDYTVEAWYLPDLNGDIDTAYLYQGEAYIGEAINIEGRRYNECRAEWTARDEENYLFQNKEVAKFHKRVRDRKSELPAVGILDACAEEKLAAVHTDILPDIEFVYKEPAASVP